MVSQILWNVAFKYEARQRNLTVSILIIMESNSGFSAGPWYMVECLWCDVQAGVGWRVVHFADTLRDRSAPTGSQRVVRTRDPSRYIHVSVNENQ
jgi:hypothetical protein